MTATKFTCQCSRCDGTGRYDRGTCFDCKGLGYVNRVNTRGLTPFILKVVYSNGSINTPRVFASTREKAVMIVVRMMTIKGYTGQVE
jgi:hypothetical protein